MNKNTKIVWKPIDDLIPYEHNAKEHTETQINNLAKSFEQNGWQNIVLIDENDVIIYGHGRCLGAKKAGLTEAPCVVCTDLSEEEIKRFRHLDNLLSEGDYIQEAFDLDLPDLSDYDFSELELNINLLDVSESDFDTEFTLPDEDKSEFCKLTFTFHEKQKELIDYAMSLVKDDIQETFGNSNSNGNALYEVVRQWAELKK